MGKVVIQKIHENQCITFTCSKTQMSYAQEAALYEGNSESGALVKALTCSKGLSKETKKFVKIVVNYGLNYNGVLGAEPLGEGVAEDRFCGLETGEGFPLLLTANS